MGKYAVLVLVAVLLLASCGPVGTAIPQGTPVPTATPTPNPSLGSSVLDNRELGYWFDLQYTWPSSQKQEVLEVDRSDPWQVKITSVAYPQVILWIRTTDRLGGLYTAEELASYWNYADTAQKTKSMIGGEGDAFAVPSYEVLLEFNGLYKEYWVATGDFSYLLTLYVDGLTMGLLETATEQLSESESDLVDCLSKMKLHFNLYHRADYVK